MLSPPSPGRGTAGLAVGRDQRVCVVRWCQSGVQRDSQAAGCWQCSSSLSLQRRFLLQSGVEKRRAGKKEVSDLPPPQRWL